jgi:vacuolar-type H+-ATPase subunit F/Vma7
MRARVIFIGDEVAAAGFRLAGARVVVPQAGREEEALAAARAAADLILIGAETAVRLPRPVLSDAVAARSPLVFVVPDVRGRVTLPDPVASLQGQLGVTE